jgi:hypothetical protein
MTPSGIDPAILLFVAQCLNHCATTIWCRCNGESADGNDQTFEIRSLEKCVVFMVLVNTMWFSQLREKAGLNF